MNAEVSPTFAVGVHLFLQLLVILAACRLAGMLFRLAGQTQVVSEMIAGVLLGPSLLGLLWPEAQAFLFPQRTAEGGLHPSTAILYAMSQVGLALYMFLIGLQLDLGLVKRHLNHAAAISVAGVAAPMVVGAGAGWMLAGNSDLFAPGMQPWQAGLFLVSAFAITAFPMLARILHESGLSRSRIGTLAIGAAACDDAAAWCLLAVVTATATGQPIAAALTIAGTALYTAGMLLVARPRLARLRRLVEQRGALSTDLLAVVLIIVLACSWLTDIIGVYAIFGAFIAGLSMPRGLFAEEVTRQIEPVTVTLLLPLFFVYSGLSTKLSLLFTPFLIGLTLIFCLLALLSKGIPCYLAARWSGCSRREAAGLGVLMNARGMIGLILLNIGFERQLISQGMFTILVVVAIVTTLVASPLFHRVYYGSAVPAPGGAAAEPAAG